jgi:hypothetical protein
MPRLPSTLSQAAPQGKTALVGWRDVSRAAGRHPVFFLNAALSGMFSTNVRPKLLVAFCLIPLLHFFD